MSDKDKFSNRSYEQSAIDDFREAIRDSSLRETRLNLSHAANASPVVHDRNLSQRLIKLIKQNEI